MKRRRENRLARVESQTVNHVFGREDEKLLAARHVPEADRLVFSVVARRRRGSYA